MTTCLFANVECYSNIASNWVNLFINWIDYLDSVDKGSVPLKNVNVYKTCFDI